LREWRLIGVWSSSAAVARGEERRRWRLHRVQGGDGHSSRRAACGPRLPSRVKEPVILGSPTIRGVGGASVGSAASGQGGRRDARSEQQGGSGGMWRRRWPAGLRAMTRRCTHAARAVTWWGRKRAPRQEDRFFRNS
jgi:hypothetical protein